MRLPDQSAKGFEINGRAGSSNDLSRPETERSRQGLEEIPVSPERPQGDLPEPGLGYKTPEKIYREVLGIKEEVH